MNGGRPSNDATVLERSLSPRISIPFQPWRELAALAMLLMDLTWGSAWLRIIRSDLSFATPYLLLGVPLFLSYALLRIMQAFRFQLSVQRLLALLLYLISAAWATQVLIFPGTSSLPEFWRAFLNSFQPPQFLPPALLVLISYALIFVRGVLLAGRWIGPSVIQAGFRWGSVMWAAALTIIRFGLRPILPDMYVFFLSMLTASYAVRAAGLRVVRGGRMQRFRGRWLAPLVVLASLTAGLFLVLGSALSLLAPLVARLTILVAGLAVLLFLLLSLPLLWLVYITANRILENPAALEVIREVTGRVVAVFQFFLGIFFEVLRRAASIAARIPDLRWLRVVLFAIVILGPVLLFLRLIRHRKRALQKAALPDEEVEQLGGETRVGAGLQGILQEGWNALRAGILDLLPRQDPAARIRIIYIELLGMAAALGAVRRQAQTPLEFLPAVRSAFVKVDAEVDLITRTYVAVRYGEKPEPDLALVESAWERVRKAGEDIITARRIHTGEQHGRAFSSRPDKAV